MIPYLSTVLDIIHELARRIPIREKRIVITVEDKEQVDRDGKPIPKDTQ